jgi:hypothetical protein
MRKTYALAATVAMIAALAAAPGAAAATVDETPVPGLTRIDPATLNTAGPFAANSLTLDKELRNLKDMGRCLDDSAAYGLRAHGCSDASYANGYQQWEVKDAARSADGRTQWASLRNIATGKCLDYSAANGLRLHTCSWTAFSNGYQGWNW